MRRTFSFLRPHQIAAIPNMDAKKLIQQSQYIVTAMLAKAGKNMLFLAPYNAGLHWVLIAIDPFAEIVYYLDPLHGDPDNRHDMKNLFDQAILMFCANNPAKVTKVKADKVKWVQVKCPRQTNSVDCGYYVMRFMKEIIAHKSHVIPVIPDTYFQDIQRISYSQDELEEVRDKWSKYIFECT